jgi:aldose 1-epimerase
MSWGAVLQDLRLAGHDAPLVLGFDRFEDYPAHSPYCGAVAGRCANRIAHGRFTIDGEHYQADLNDHGRNTLHGGSDGFGRRNWRLAEAGPDSVTLTLHDSDGAMGFPGALDVTCTYHIRAPGTLRITFEAVCDRPTLCNLAPHSYFNLDNGGAGDILGHRLMIHAGAYLPITEDEIPTGVVEPVQKTPFDFMIPREIRRDEAGEQLKYDHNFCLAAARRPLSLAAWAQGAGSGVELEVWTTEPGLQFYAGYKVDVAVPGHGGRRYKPYSGFCLEPQIWPDSPNRPYFPQAVLRPGETYRHVTEYRFKMG